MKTNINTDNYSIMDTNVDMEQMQELENMFNKKNKDKENIADKLDKLYNTNIFDNDLDNNIINDNYDELKQKTLNFINNCIMKSNIKYDKNKKLNVLNLLKLNKNILDYNEDNKISIISTKNKHSFIIYYMSNGKWNELSCNGLKNININDKYLNICIEKFKTKDKFRKNINKYQLRGTKLKFLNEKYIEFDLFVVSKINI